jgi:hypothetical protein
MQRDRVSLGERRVRGPRWLPRSGPLSARHYFREAAEVINAAAGSPPDRAKFAEIMRRHGLTPAPPPVESLYRR